VACSVVYGIHYVGHTPQVMHQLPTLSIDKTDGCQVYLSQESINCEIITAKSSEMNILIPDKSGEFVSNCHEFFFDVGFPSNEIHYVPF